MAANMNEIVMLEATLYDYSPRTAVVNPFKPSGKRWLPGILLAAATRPVVGRVQLLVRKSAMTASGSSDARCHVHVTHWLRFEDVAIRNDRDLPLYVLLSRASDAILEDDRSVRQLEASALPVLLDRGPEGQWKGSHFPRMFEQELLTFDPLAFASIAIGKPATARPPTALMLVFAHGAFQTFVPPTKSSEQLALEMDTLSTRLLQSVMEMEQDQLQGEDELSLDALQRNAHQLFRMFDQDKSDSIDFEEYKQMLAYRKLNLLESKAKRFFQLVDDQKKGYIDEREFVVALYITNYLRAHQRKQKQQSATASEGDQVLSPTDVFHQLDGDRDELLNVFEYEKALELLGVSRDTKRARAKALELFPQSLVAMDLPTFKRAWVKLVNVHSELRKRNVDVSSGTSSQKKGGRTIEYLRSALLAEIDREEQEELLAALQAKEEVVRLEKQRREAEQEESRRLFQQQRHAATSTRTKEALRERQDNINRKKERVIKDRQAREERRLLQRAELETKKRTTHEREVVQELMASKMERITRQKARCGDDIVDLRGRALKVLPAELYHGRDALTSLSSLLILDLARNRLQSLPGVIFTHLFSLQSLNVSENDLETLPEELGEARDLQMLDAHSNRLTAVPMGLKNLHQLRVLHLAYNHLVRFGDACGSLRSLEELNLSANALEVLADAMGDALVKLVHLNLRGNSALRRLPNSLQRLSCLTVWDLSACAQKRLGKGVFGAQLRSLRSLNLSFNALTTLPEGVGALKILQDLNIKANALATLPSSVGHLTELVLLNGENNALERLPATCGDQWGALERLQLSHNRLTTLPVTFGLLRSLRTLQLASNRLTKLPLELGALVNLRELDVSWNQLTSLPEELGCLEALTTLDLSHNKLASFPETIAMWQQLTSLRCSHNALTTPLTTAFAHLQVLQYVDLAQNHLSALEPCLYELRTLEVLNLGGNCITLLPREMAQHCVALRKLDLHSNRLRALPVELADGLLAQLEVLSIGRNPLNYLPAKCSSKWRLEDQYQTSFANGYTPAEAKSWLIDQQAIYPEIVRVWDELAAPVVGAEGSGEDRVDFVGTCRSVAKVSSDEFCRHVVAAMVTKWQPRYERLVRHYYYEFKYVGHAIVFNASDQQQYGKQNAVFEMELQLHRQELADRAIQKSNEDRARLEAMYYVDQALVTQTAERLADKRNEQRQRVLENGRHEAQVLNVVVSEKLAISLRIREETQQRQRTAFADEMRRLVRERLQAKQQRRNHEGKGGSRKIVAVVTDEREEGEQFIT